MNIFDEAMRMDGRAPRLPVVEWAKWWEETTQRWVGEGLDSTLSGGALAAHLGLDQAQRVRFRCLRNSFPELPYGQGCVDSMESYERIRPHLFPELTEEQQAQARALNDIGPGITWYGVDGFFWFPRILFGIENHLYAFYDYPDVMHRMNADLLAYLKKILTQAVLWAKPDFVAVTEDMSYKQGSMISRGLFDEFLLPYYQELFPFIRSLGMPVFVDTDGNVDELAGWLLEAGVDGILPVERQSGSDPVKLRERYPTLRMIGGIDKRVLKGGKDAVMRQLEALMPAISQGGFIPSCDHQTPPDVSLENYREYVRCLRSVLNG